MNTPSARLENNLNNKPITRAQAHRKITNNKILKMVAINTNKGNGGVKDVKFRK